MTDNENWAIHLRQVGAEVVPPTPADPHSMADVAVRRTHVRRAVAMGGSVTGIVAMVAGTAFALSGPGQAPEALPGTAAVSTTEAASASPADDGVPAGWHPERLGKLSYALPPDIVTSGPSQDEPGVESQMWHDRLDPDAPPFLRVEVVTPDYEFYDTDAAGLRSTPGTGAETFDVAGASAATVEDATGELMEAAGVFGGGARPVRIIVHPDGGDDRYVIHLNLPAEGSDELLAGLQGSLRMD